MSVIPFVEDEIAAGAAVRTDDPDQSPKASALIESLTAEQAGFVSLVTVIELVWVLGSCYSATRGEVTQVLETLLRTKELVLAQAETVWKAVRLFKEGKADFADCLVERCGADAGCSATLTFDVGAAKHCGMRLID